MVVWRKITFFSYSLFLDLCGKTRPIFSQVFFSQVFFSLDSSIDTDSYSMTIWHNKLTLLTYLAALLPYLNTSFFSNRTFKGRRGSRRVNLLCQIVSECKSKSRVKNDISKNLPFFSNTQNLTSKRVIIRKRICVNIYGFHISTTIHVILTFC